MWDLWAQCILYAEGRKCMGSKTCGERPDLPLGRQALGEILVEGSRRLTSGIRSHTIRRTSDALMGHRVVVGKGYEMRPVSLLTALILCSVAALAQTATGTITGTISDPAGAVVANASLELKNSETGTVSQTVSSSTGNYNFAQLPAATYQLTVNVPGFKTH